MKKIRWRAVLLVGLLLVSSVAAPAAYAAYASGTTGGPETVPIRADGSGAYMVLSSDPGLASVRQHTIDNFAQNGEESTHGFYRVTVTGGSGYRDSFIWAPSATAHEENVRTSQDVRVTLPYSGSFTLTVDPLSPKESSYYWRVDTLNYWIRDAGWILSAMDRCSVGRAGGTVTVYCYDENSRQIGSMNKSVSDSCYVSPPDIGGYTAVSGSQFVSLDGSGACSPPVLYFYYRKTGGRGGLPSLPYASYSLSLRDPYAERIRPQCGPGYNYQVFASMNGSTRLYKPRDITFLRACFLTGNWVYLEFGYTDGVRRFGFFEKDLFYCSSWNSVPEYSLSAEQAGTVTSSVTPYNGPGTDCGSYSSCSLSAGDRVYACMESDGWYLCRFYNGHGNSYGTVYLWVPGHYIRWN